MIKQGIWILLIIGVFFISGCAALGVGVAAVGAGSGTYFYINGELRTDYYYPFDKVWGACEKTIADMHGVDVEPKKELSSGTITATIDNEKVQFGITYKAKNVTSVAVRVGVMGNKLGSQRLHDKIGENLMKK